MKAYILTFALAWATFCVIYVGCATLVIGLVGFLTWYLPEGIPYLVLLRCVVVAGFVTTLFYMPSKEGKEGLKAIQGIWK